MFSLSPIKVLVVVAVVLILLGPDKLPEVAHKLGSTWRAIKRLQEKVETEVREALPDLPSTGDLARLARSPVTLLNELADRAEARERVAAADEESPHDEAVSPPEVVPDAGVADAEAPGALDPTPLITPVPTRVSAENAPTDGPVDPSLN